MGKKCIELFTDFLLCTKLFFALAIPLDDPVSTKAISVAFFFEANYQLPNPENERAEIEEEKKSDTREIRSIVARRRVIDRRAVYTMLESKFESLVLHLIPVKR